MSTIIIRTGAAHRSAPVKPDEEHRQKHKTDPSHTRICKKTAGARQIVNRHLAPFSRKLAAMLSAGMPIVSALRSLEKQATSEEFKMVIAEIRHSIENGLTFSHALKRFPSVFDSLYVSMVSCGESSGQMPESIRRQARFLESSQRLRRKVKSAMIYPAAVLCIAFVIATGMIIFVVPVFSSMFDAFERALPAPTLFLLKLSEFMRDNGVQMIMAGSVLVIALRKYIATQGGAYNADRLMLRLPVFGDLTRKVASARFARAFAQLLNSGVPMFTSLGVVSDATGNRVAGKIITESRTVVERGDPLSSALMTQSVFPDTLVDMLEAGEQTGRIDEMMECVADFYEDEVNMTLDNLTSLLEPILIVLLGIIIGSLLVCLFMPLFQISDIV